MKCECEPNAFFVWCDHCLRRTARKDAQLDAWHRNVGETLCDPMPATQYVARIKANKY